MLITYWFLNKGDLDQESLAPLILNLTQYIEDGYEKKHITGVAPLDLSAAYDAVNHKNLANKIHQITKDYRLTRFIKGLL